MKTVNKLIVLCAVLSAATMLCTLRGGGGTQAQGTTGMIADKVTEAKTTAGTATSSSGWSKCARRSWTGDDGDYRMGFVDLRAGGIGESGEPASPHPFRMTPTRGVGNGP
jgi:hypothetical protein